MRITGGTHRSRALRAPRGNATRPTSDRVREALFGILGSAGAVHGANVLDLYAGTGALGLEALSRGAARAVLVESSRDALAALRGNVTALELEAEALVLACDVRDVVRRAPKGVRFDLVLADPPWALVDDGAATLTLEAIVAGGLVSDDALVVLEHAARSTAPSVAGLEAGETRRYGDTALTFYRPTSRVPEAIP